MSVILGLNAFHSDASVCIVIDGELKFAVAEERLGNRDKHTPAVPENAIRAALKECGLKLSDVTHVATARSPKSNFSQKVKYSLSNPKRSMGAAWEFVSRNRRSADIIDRLPEICRESPDSAKYEVVNVEHHLAHIASSYYCSPFETLTAGLSYDGSGDFVSMMAARCEGTKIETLDRVALPDSLGFFYTALCQFIGFDEFGEEYKVMGLAPYGDDKYGDIMKDLLRLEPDGWFSLNRKYFGMHEGGRSDKLDGRGHLVMGRMFTKELEKILGSPRDRNTSDITQREMDIARSCQVRFEEAAVHCLLRLHKLVPTNQLVMAGGCALNGVANARILRETPFDAVYQQCASSDDGTCIGAALWCYHNVVNGAKRFHMKHAFWGPSHDDQEIREAVEASGFTAKYFENDEELIDEVASLIANNNVLGWYQGRSEWGPRALGNRSILANPAHPDMKDIINRKIKRRESFRPFAPTVLKERMGDYFEQIVESPFMMHVVKFKPEWREKLPAVAHVDGTGRVQSLAEENNPKYYRLLKKFEELTGVGIFLNTSFNENEPIVETPEQGLDCFKRTDMDVICLGNWVVFKDAVTRK